MVNDSTIFAHSFWGFMLANTLPSNDIYHYGLTYIIMFPIDVFTFSLKIHQDKCDIFLLKEKVDVWLLKIYLIFHYSIMPMNVLMVKT